MDPGGEFCACVENNDRGNISAIGIVKSFNDQRIAPKRWGMNGGRNPGSVEPESLCMGCMRDKGLGAAEDCLHCGWREGTPPESAHQLAPRTVLNGTYLVGRALGQGGFGITYLAWDLNLNRKLAIKEYFPRDLCARSRDESTVQPITRAAAKLT